MNENEAPAEAPIPEEVFENPNPQPSPILTLTIVLNQATGAMELTGPMNNQMMVYALLEMARNHYDRYLDRQRAQQGAESIVPAFQIPQGLRPPGRKN